MEADLEGIRGNFAPVLEELAALRQFPGAPREFWPRLLAVAAQLTTADMAVLLVGQPGKTPRWGKLTQWTATPSPSRMRTEFTTRLEATADRCLQQGNFVDEQDERAGSFITAVRLKLTRPEEEVILAAHLLDATEAAAREALVRLMLLGDTPALYQAGQVGRQAAADVEKFAGVLDLLVPVNEAERFLSAALAFCNGTATRFRCDRVSLGWLDRGYIRLRAISRTESFDRRMAAAQALERVMEECVDQDEEVLWPAGEGASVVTRAHEQFAADQKAPHLCSLPLRRDGKAAGVLTCERAQSPFTETEVQQLRLGCDLAARRLGDLAQRDRWFGRRWAESGRSTAASWLGPEHTASKLLALLIAAALVVLVFVRVNYRVEGNFILRSDKASFLTAPFDGYIEQVFVRPGDHVEAGAPLLSLKRNELLLDQAAALAEWTRYERESEKARAAKNLAEMRIDAALAQEARARLDLVQYRLDNAVIRAPFEGLVVEGDLRERIAAPVKQGDALYKVARIDSLYAEAEIRERDLKEILGHDTGQIAFVTRPKAKYDVTVQTLEPAAVTKKDGNVFLLRLRPVDPVASWWRPGMTGLCKLSVEKRSLLWILTHRTVDFLRMKLWF